MATVCGHPAAAVCARAEAISIADSICATTTIAVAPTQNLRMAVCRSMIQRHPRTGRRHSPRPMVVTANACGDTQARPYPGPPIPTPAQVTAWSGGGMVRRNRQAARVFAASNRARRSANLPPSVDLPLVGCATGTIVSKKWQATRCVPLGDPIASRSNGSSLRHRS